MNYEIGNDVLQSITQQFARPTPRWRRRALCVLFGLLGLLVILGCTIVPSAVDVVVLIGGLGVCIAAILRPQLALHIVFIGAGLPSFLLPIPGHNMHPVEIGLWLCFLIIVLWRPHLRLHLPHLLALLYLAIAVVSFIHVPEFSTGVDAYTPDKRLFGVVLSVLAFFCGAFLVKYVKDATSFLVIVLLSNTPLYFIALAQALHLHVPSILASSDPSQLEGRLPGPFITAVDFSMYLINLFAIALACWLMSEHRSHRIVGLCMTIGSGLAIISTGTRSAAIAAGVALLVSFTLTRRFKLLAVLLVLAGMMTIVFANKIIPLFSHDPTSTSNRIFLWQTAISLIFAHPWIGIGLWKFPAYYAQYIVSLSSELNPHGGVSVHEQYLEWGMEGGIFWLIVGTLLLLTIVYICWQAFRIAQRKHQVFLLAAILALLANMTVALFDVPLDKTEGTVFLFLLAGLAVGFAVREREKMVFVQDVYIRAKQSMLAVSMGSVLGWSHPAQVQVVTPSQARPSSPATPAKIAESAAPNAQKTGRSIIIQLLSWALPIPLVFPMTALLTRYLGAVQYGEYSFTLSLLAILVLFTGLAIDSLVMRQLSKKPREEWSEVLSYAVGTRLVLTTFIVGVTILVSLFWPMSAEQRNLLILGSITLFFSFSVGSLHTTFDIGFRLEQRVNALTLIGTIDRLVTAALVWLIVLLHLSLLWACFLILFSDIPFCLIGLLRARRHFGIRLRFSYKRARELILSSLPLIGYDIMFLIAGQADLLFLMALSGPQSVGIYALASRIIDPLLSIVLAYAIGLYPLFCTKFGEGRELFATVYYESIRVLALVIVPLAILVTIEAKPIVALLGGQGFTEATIAVQLLMWAMVVTFFNQLTIRACIAAHLERRMMYATVVSSAVNIILNVTLIPFWHIMGAGIASLVSEIIGFSLLILLLRPHIRFFSMLVMIFRVLLGNLPMLLLLIWLQKLPILLIMPLSLLLSLVGCVVTRTISFKDIALMRNIVYSRSKKGAAINQLAEDIADQSTKLMPTIKGFNDWPTGLMPVIDDFADLPTTILPAIHL